MVAVSLLSAPTVRAAGVTLSLVQDGKAVYTVVVPDGKDAVAMSAATMLADTVDTVTAAIPTMPLCRRKNTPRTIRSISR